ncbi:MAG: Ig-like domain-containing protein [Gemmatimonadales bacterium]
MARPARRPGRKAQIPRLLLASVALLLACASVGDPPGGPPDVAPPTIVSVKPESGAVIPNLKDDAVIQFDEVIEEQDGGGRGGVGGLAQHILLSPVAGPVKVSWHRTRVTVKPKEGWKRRVYRLEILPGFVDLRRNRLDSTKTILFSTGPEIGHARIGGIALKWIEQNVLVRALIEAVPLPDSVGYLTMADSGGQFNVENLQPGRYIVYATADENGDRRRGPRELYDSVAVTLDSSVNVALYTFPHDTAPPRPRTATFVDSVSVRVEFSQALEPTASFDTAHLHVLELPDSTPVTVARILTQRQFDSLTAAAQQKADSAAEAARDTSAAPPPRIHPRPPPPAPSPAGGRPAARPSARPSVDTALVRQLLARRPIPSDKIVIQLVQPLQAETRYAVRIEDATNLIGKKGEGYVSFTVPKPTPADTTRRARP